MDPKPQNDQNQIPNPQPVAAPVPGSSVPAPAVPPPPAQSPAPVMPTPAAPSSQQAAQAPVPTPAVVAPAPAPQPSVPAPPPQQNPSFNAQQQANIQVQNGMRNTILKIIAVLSGVSMLIVIGLFLLSSAADGALTNTRSDENDQAEFAVPESWNEDNTERSDAYYNSDTPESSQATMVILKPVKVSFDSQRISDNEIRGIINDYRRAADSDNGVVDLSDPVELQVASFYVGFDFELSGVAPDGTTEVRGLSRVLFDDDNYAHTIEFLAVRSYWDANETQIRDLIDTYTLKAEGQ